MQFFIAPWEVPFLHATLRFANMRRINSAQEVERVFSALFLGGTFLSIGDEPDAAQKYCDERAVLEKMLSDLVSGDQPRRKDIIGQLRKRIDAIRFRVVVMPDGKQRLTAARSGVEGCYWYAISLLVDPKRGLVDRLKVCDATEGQASPSSFEKSAIARRTNNWPPVAWECSQTFDIIRMLIPFVLKPFQMPWPRIDAETFFSLRPAWKCDHEGFATSVAR